MKCPKCNTEPKDTKLPFYYFDIYLGMFDAESCECGHMAFFTEESYNHIEAIARDKGCWGGIFEESD